MPTDGIKLQVCRNGNQSECTFIMEREIRTHRERIQDNENKTDKQTNSKGNGKHTSWRTTSSDVDLSTLSDAPNPLPGCF